MASPLALPILIAHYKPLASRKESMLRQLATLDLTSFQFIEDHDKGEISQATIASNYLHRDDTWAMRMNYIQNLENNLFHKNGDAVCDPRKLRESEISLALKHFEMYRIIVENKWNYAMILEDDVLFLDNFLDDFQRNFARTPADWDIVFFGNGCGFRVPNPLSDQHVYQMRPARGKCTDSYLISHRFAQSLLNRALPFTQPIDYELEYWMNVLDAKCYWWEPWLVVQGSQTGHFPSAIQGSGEGVGELSTARDVDALRALERGEAQARQMAESAPLAALDAYLAGDAGRAESACHALLADANETARPLAAYILGLLLLERGEALGAIPLLQAAMSQVPVLAEMVHNLGLAHWRAGHGEEALDCFHQAITLDRAAVPGIRPARWVDDGDGALVFDVGFTVDGAYAQAQGVRRPTRPPSSIR